MKALIYSLSDPRTNKIRYVGYTKKSLAYRLKIHLKYSSLKQKTYKNNWIKQLLNNDLKPNIELLDEVPYSEWRFWECFYIDLCKSWGYKLTNLAIGGQGGTVTKDHPRYLEINKSKGRKGRISNRKGIVMSQEQKDRISKSLMRNDRKNSNWSKESRKIISNTHKGKDLSGDKNPMWGKGKKILVEGKIFNTQRECAKFLGVHLKTIQYRLKSGNFSNYSYL